MPELTSSRIGIHTHLFPEGPLNDPARNDALRQALRACLASHELHVVVDLTDVPLINSEALEVLLDAQDELLRIGGTLRAMHANALIEEIFDLTGLAERITPAAVRRGNDGEARRTPEAAGQRIGAILEARGAVSRETIEKALKLQAERGGRMAQLMVDEGWLPEHELLGALAEQLVLPFVRLRVGLYDPQIVKLIDAQVTRRLNVLPLFRIRGILYLATADPQSIPIADEIEHLSGCRVRPILACTDEIRRFSADAYSEASDLAQYVGDLVGDLELVESRVPEGSEIIDEMAAGSPVISLINGVIQRAVRDRASDIHIEPSRNHTRIRLRVDGLLYTIMTPSIEAHPALISRLKVMAKLDIAERRMPQDGRIQVVTGGRNVDLRFSSLPGIFGEKVVLRVLDKNESILDIDKLGLSPQNRQRLTGLLDRSYGLILVTGPTGSGKTTTLYAGINYLTSDEKNIVTIEDPVEYQIDAISQNQIREGIGLSFAKALKHVLRQDPDVIMIGEIRERETAEIAVQAALTGHLVLSTLHTNNSIGAVTRLLDMGVQPFLLSSALIGVMAQRLLRKVCPSCKASYTAPPDALAGYGVEVDGKVRLVRGRGCPSCYDSGYKGRMAIHEILETEPELQRLIVSNPSRSELDAYMQGRGVKTLLSDGIERAIAGQTTVEEALRVVSS